MIRWLGSDGILEVFEGLFYQTSLLLNRFVPLDKLQVDCSAERGKQRTSCRPDIWS